MSINPVFMPMTMGGGGYIGLITGLTPLLWYRFDEAASPAINYGSVASVDGVVADMGGFQQATGLAAIPYAYDWNGTTSIVSVPAAAGLRSADFTIVLLMNADGLGELSAGFFMDAQDTASVSSLQWRWLNSGTDMLVSLRNTAGTNHNTTTSGGATLSAWQWLFVQFNTATALFSIWKSVTGTLTEFSYASRVAVTLTPRQILNFAIGSNIATTQAWDGRMAQFMYFGSLLTTVQMQSIITASGVV